MPALQIESFINIVQIYIINFIAPAKIKDIFLLWKTPHLIVLTAKLMKFRTSKKNYKTND